MCGPMEKIRPKIGKALVKNFKSDGHKSRNIEFEKEAHVSANRAATASKRGMHRLPSLVKYHYI